MIHHISIDAHDPCRVARVLAEIWQGKVYQFLVPGSYTDRVCLGPYRDLCTDRASNDRTDRTAGRLARPHPPQE